jgi:hypothetical protein
MNLCTGCGEDFACLTAFEKHRVGKYPQTGPSEYTERLEQGLVHPNEQWRPDPRFGRRCLTIDEMQQRGMHKDTRGRWRLPTRGAPPWGSDVRAKKARKAGKRPLRRPTPKPGRRRDTSPRRTA